jgi:hypothetical protein
LTGSKYLHFVLCLFEVVVKDCDRAPYILLVLKDWRQGMRPVRASLAVLNPLFNSLVFFPSVVTSERFDAGKVWAAVENLHLFVENLQGLLGFLILVWGVLVFFEKSFLANNVFVLFNNISMSRWQALDFKLFKIHQLENNI